MDYFYKRFDSTLATCNFKGWNAAIFEGLDEYADDTKDSGQHVADMCLIKTADSQIFSHIWNDW